MKHPLKVLITAVAVIVSVKQLFDALSES